MTYIFQATTSEVLPYARVVLTQGKRGAPLMFWGSPGTAKSDVARQMASDPVLISMLLESISDSEALPYGGKSALAARYAAHGLPIIDLRAGSFDRVDLNGIPTVLSVPGEHLGRTVWNPPGLLPIESRDGPFGILLLDEYSNAPKATQGAFLQLLLDGQLGEYKLPPGWRIVGTGNLQRHGASANVLSTASNNRVAHVELLPCVKAWTSNFAAPAGVHPAIVAFLNLRETGKAGAQVFNVMPEDPEQLAFPTARTWTKLSEALYAAGADWQTMAYGLACMWVGVAAAIEFRGFLACWGELPRLAQIESDPAGAPVPTELTAKFAVAAMLGRAATAANMSPVCIYLDRLGAAFSELGVQQAIGRDPSLKATAGYVNRALARPVLN